MKNQDFRYYQLQLDREMVSLLGQIKKAKTLEEIREAIDCDLPVLHENLGKLEKILW